MDSPALCGLVLAAGAGTRFGGPKALARSADGTPWLHAAVRMLRAAGCAEVLVALGAGGHEAAGLVPAAAEIVHVAHGGDGLSATLRAGIAAVEDMGADAVLITPVDTPDAPASAAIRVISLAGTRAGLAQATYGGEPGHPVFIGADHFADVITSLSGDRGAGQYLREHGALAVECGDLWSGADIDQR
ncbi:nucleotidyltransferase family protein [Microbacterium rhizomatis]|uniref:nucleotidyltransferase family protein n=1 Tax=Microbacterium rhizomatis TaxID=1631477 RepID=UPI001FE3EDEF|nr:nucleotidyltransferase family protein [Microbacterium rhizomatis]